MKHPFKILSLEKKQFLSLMKQSDTELERLNAYWLTVGQSPGFPCRVSLQDAKLGERVLVCNYDHHPVNSPYRANGPIFVREKAMTAKLSANQVPPVLNGRKLSFRAYSANHQMIDACVVEGAQVVGAIQGLFDDIDVQYIHIHNAAPGCFSCEVQRIAISEEVT